MKPEMKPDRFVDKIYFARYLKGGCVSKYTAEVFIMESDVWKVARNISKDLPEFQWVGYHVIKDKDGQDKNVDH